jgi:hypothetical protein
MYYTQQELMNGNSNIAEYYKNAKKLWEEIDIESPDLSNELKHKQNEFEHACGGRTLGKEIMAWSGLILYMNKEEKNIEAATKIYTALAKGSCSQEVKVSAKNAGAYFELTTLLN